MTLASAVAASRGSDLDALIGAREFAESMGYAAFRTKASMPTEFAGEPVLSEGFADGLANAQCEHEQVRAGLL